MSLGRTGSAIGKIQTGIEPLWRVGSTHLLENHEGYLVVKSLSIIWSIEIMVFFTPIFPTANHTMNNLFNGVFAAGHRMALIIGNNIAIFVALWNPCFPEVLLGKNISSNLRPVLRNFNISHLKDLRAVRIA